MKLTINTEGKRYTVEVFMMKPLEGVYRFGVQIWGGGEIFPFSIRLPKKFVEEEIDANNDKGYLENLTMRVVVDHLKDILSLDRNGVMANLIYWFNDAKYKYDEEVKDGNTHETVK